MDLPWIYTGGFVKRSVMDHIRDKMGRCFSSSIPDVYSGVAVASVLPTYGYSHFPLAINGTSARSNGVQCFSANRKERSKIDFFRDNGTKFLEHLGDGFIHSLCFLTYESYLQSAPLREFDVDTTLDEQLLLAMLQAKKAHYTDVMDYCREVAIQNNLDFGQIADRCRRGRMRQYVRKKLGQLIPVLRKQGARHKTAIKNREISTVMQAAKEAARVLGTRSSAAES